jgi:hypothetical protein
MLGPPSVERKSVRRVAWKRILASLMITRAVLVLVLRVATLFVRLVRLLFGGE